MGKEGIRKGTWIIFVFFVLGFFILIGSASFLGTLQNLITSWQFYVGNILIILSLIGLFAYKKWGFYLFTIYLIYILIDNVINIISNFATFWITWFVIYLVVYGYFIWYRLFYKNKTDFS